MCLGNIAAPDALGVGASNLGVAGAGEDVGVASFLVAIGILGVCPAFSLSCADTVHACHVGLLAEPATDEDVLEIIGLSGSKNLTETSGVELVLHLAVSVVAGLQGVGLKGGVVAEVGETELCAPGVDDAHVARVSGRSGRRAWGGRRAGLRAGLGFRAGLRLRARCRLVLRLRAGCGLVCGLRGGLDGLRRRSRLRSLVLGRTPVVVPVLGLRGRCRRSSSIVDGLTVRANDDSHESSLPDDNRALRTGVGHSSTRKGEHTESGVCVHFEILDFSFLFI